MGRVGMDSSNTAKAFSEMNTEELLNMVYELSDGAYAPMVDKLIKEIDYRLSQRDSWMKRAEFAEHLLASMKGGYGD
jgi:hypothetical protein